MFFSANVDLFSKFFHAVIRKKILCVHIAKYIVIHVNIIIIFNIRL